MLVAPINSDHPLEHSSQNPIRNSTISTLNSFSLSLSNQPPSTTSTAQCSLWMTILPPQSNHCAVNSRVSKCDLVLFVRNKSANMLEKPLQIFDCFLPFPNSIFFHYQPELYANRSKPHYSAIKCLAQRHLEANAKFICGKSGLVLGEIYSLNLNVVCYNSFLGSARSPLPKFLQNKKAIVKVQNDVDRSFKYAIAFALHPIQH